MTVGAGGVEYENRVLRALKPQIKLLPNIEIKQGTSTAAFAANEPDLQLVIFGTPVNIEIKQDSKAQMGGGSFNFDLKTGKFFKSAKTEIDADVEKTILKILNAKKKNVIDVLNFAKKNDLPGLSKDVKGLPLRASKDTWEAITKARLLVPLNTIIETDIDFLYDHYEHKNCFYIQMGNAGLFYLKRNPLNLPVPQLSSKFNVELRLGRSGSSYVAAVKTNVASGSIRAQGRLNGRVSSPYSLDKTSDFTKLFGPLTKKDLQKYK